MRYLMLFTLSAALAAAAPTPPELRLPTTVAPTSYQVRLELDPAKPTFSGVVTVNLDVKQATNVVWLNGVDLAVQQVQVTAGGKTLSAHAVDGGKRFIGIETDGQIPAGKALAKLTYRGKIRQKDSSGIFAMEDGGNRYLFTQFEPIDARAAFPCFDEPSYKVPWQLTLEVPAHLTAVSNTEPTSEKRDGDHKVVTFRETKPLPSYLVALGVGPFEFVDGGKAGRNKIPVRIVTPKGRAKEAQYAAQVTATIIGRLEDYFGIPFPYSKSDQLAIPNTYGFGAMENAGLVTYEQSILLADPARDTEARRRAYATTAAHELAHQWFGDLVTTAWWNDIWLNEAFATWMEQKIIRDWKPEWNTKLDDVTSKLYAENQDSLLTARKIRQEIESEGDIGNAFDGITYQKGAAVIGMFEHYVGEGSFQKGVTQYLRQYSFRNADAPEFLDSISSASKKNVNAAFSSFLNQGGVPVVKASLECKGGTGELALSQSRYVPAGEKAPGDQLWQIPVCVRTDKGTSCQVMSQQQQTIPIAGGCPAWVQVNDNATGYYRVQYSDAMLRSLTEGSVDLKLHPTERIDLMGNAEAMTQAGSLPVGSALGLVKTFHADPEPQVIRQALTLALSPRQHLVTEDMRPNYQRFLQANFDAKAQELGWQPKQDETPDVGLLRPALVGAMATFGGDQKLSDQAKDLAEQWLAGKGSVAPAVLGAVLTTAAYHGDEHLAEQMVDKLKTTTDRQDRRRLIAAMRSFQDPAAEMLLLNDLIAGKLPSLEGSLLLYSGQDSAKTRRMGFDFVQAHFDKIMEIRPSGGGFDAAAQLPLVGSEFCSAQEGNELKSFFEPRLNNLQGAKRVLSQVLEKVNVCSARKQAEENGVSEFLKQY